MPYPETCPECGGAFRNTGTHYTARRNEVGRHVLLELGCQVTSRRYWWNFTTGQLAGVTTAESKPSISSSAEVGALATAAAPSNGASASNGHASTPRANGSQSETSGRGTGHSVIAAVPMTPPPTPEEKPDVPSTAIAP